MGRKRQGRTLTLEIEYDPLPSQSRFHESAARFKGFSGPIGSGKSQALCHEAIRLAYENPGRMVYDRFIANCVAGYETVQARAYENRYVLDKVPDFYERLKG